MIKSTLESVLKSGGVEHIRHNGRVVAVRREHERANPTGLINLTFTDERVDLRGHGNTKYDLTIKQAERAIRVFLHGQLVKIKHEQCDMVINQANRWCVVEKTTPTRLRLAYEMPNAGQMGGWWRYLAIGQFNYITN